MICRRDYNTRAARRGYTTAVAPLGEVDPAERILELRRRGYSVRQIAYLTGTPRATVGDAIKRYHDSLPPTVPFYALVDF